MNVYKDPNHNYNLNITHECLIPKSHIIHVSCSL